MLSQGLAFTTYRSQWEVNSEVVAFDIKGPVTNIPPKPIQPVQPPGGEGTDVNPGWWEIPGIGGRFTVYQFDPQSSLTWDFDDAETGMPDIRVSVSDIREEKNKTVFEPLKKEHGNFTYVTEYHEYILDVQIRTVADMKMISGQMGPEWYHETSMPYSWQSNLFGAGAEHIGKNIAGSVFVRFSVLPWGTYDYGPLPPGYQFNGYWLGVMNAKVEGDPQRGEAEQTLPSSAVTYPGDARDVAT